MTTRLRALTTAGAVAGTLGLSVVVARRFLHAHPYAAKATVIAGSAGQVELVSTQDTALPGTYRLTRGDLNVTVGSVLGTENSTVRREASTTAAGGEWAWDALMFDRMNDVDSVAETHVIHVHGQSLGPRQTFRGLGAWTSLGASSEVVDVEAFPLRALDPDTPGLIESRVRAARQRGARKVVLQGWSAGALACSVAAGQAPVDAIVAISPLLSVKTALRAAVARLHLPSALGSVSHGLVTTPGLSRLAGAPMPLRNTEWVVTPGVPVLAMYSRADRLVAQTDVDDLHEAQGAEVIAFDTAPHTLEWNESPSKWEQGLTAFAKAHSLAR